VAILTGYLLDLIMLSLFDGDPGRRMHLVRDLEATNACLDTVNQRSRNGKLTWEGQMLKA